VVIPIDHGATLGPIPGVVDLSATVRNVVGSADALLLNRGPAEWANKYYAGRASLILRIGGIPTTVGTTGEYEPAAFPVEEAVRLGADAVALSLWVGAKEEAAMLTGMGRIVTDCSRWGMPLMIEALPGGLRAEKNPFDKDLVKLAARVGAELGADMIKTTYTGSTESFKEVVEACPAPVLIAGGPRLSGVRDVFEMMKGALDAGGAGVCVGRNLWQQEDPKKMAAAVAQLVHRGATVEDAMSMIR
jgi:fructose-bisphosphate aldolase/2-amino-3,7-dideoxy-D-threo-hept-6-ulosonate synthase